MEKTPERSLSDDRAGKKRTHPQTENFETEERDVTIGGLTAPRENVSSYDLTNNEVIIY